MLTVFMAPNYFGIIPMKIFIFFPDTGLELFKALKCCKFNCKTCDGFGIFEAMELFKIRELYKEIWCLFCKYYNLLWLRHIIWLLSTSEIKMLWIIILMHLCKMYEIKCKYFTPSQIIKLFWTKLSRSRSHKFKRPLFI